MEIMEKDHAVSIKTGKINFIYEMEKGCYHIAYAQGFVMKNLFAEIKAEGSLYSTLALSSSHRPPTSQIEEIEDAFGQGVCLRVTYHIGEGLVFVQKFTLYNKKEYMVMAGRIISDTETGSNYFSLLRYEKEWGGKGFSHHFKEPKMLFVPYDNDKWIRYRANELTGILTSYEVTALYDDCTREGLVIGSVTHDQWKTGIQAYADGERQIVKFSVFCGAADEVTRDVMPHGEVKGTSIESAAVFIGFYEDFRCGLNAYADANAKMAPMLEWEEGVPFGWNSWACVQSGISFDVYHKASETLKNEFFPLGFENGGTAYVNFDAMWGNLTEEEMRRAVESVHARGQKAGTYFSPFTYWGKDIEAFVEGSHDKYRYRDILAKDNNGNILPPLDGGYPIDVTHEASIARYETMMKQAVEQGFDYVKLDFMAHGAMECVHARKEITTGTQAYHFGMKRILSILDSKKINRPFFISLSIAPIFPYQYAHSRRISCDAFGLIEDTEYMLNSLTYGFWLNNKLYRYNDPDHTVLYKSVHKRASDFNEGQSRLFASIISGTVMLLSDDYSQPYAIERSKALLNPEILALAKKGVTFIPLWGAEEDKAADVFIMEEEEKVYIAVFNYSRDEAQQKIIVLKDLGLKEGKGYAFREVGSSISYTVKDVLEIHLENAQSKIIELQK